MKLRYIFYHTKALLKKRQTWAVIVTLIFLAFVYSGITFPSIENTYIGVVTYGSKQADEMIDILSKRSALYEIKIYEDDDELKKDILNGTLECGFVFDENFDKFVDKGKLKNTIEYIYSPYTTKGLAAKETIFSAFLDTYSNKIWLKEYPKIFGSFDEDQKKEIIESMEKSNEYYKGSNVIFDIESIYYDVNTDNE